MKYIAILAFMAAAIVGNLVAEEPVTKEPTTEEVRKARAEFLDRLKAANTPAEFDNALSMFPHSRDRLLPYLFDMATAANKVWHPCAINYALMSFIHGPTSAYDSNVGAVAAALKNTDGNINRANQWIEQQGTGKNKVTFTEKELRTPALFEKHLPTRQKKLEEAIARYGAASDSFSLNNAIEFMVRALTAYDFDIVRARAFEEDSRAGKIIRIEL